MTSNTQPTLPMKCPLKNAACKAANLYLWGLEMQIPALCPGLLVPTAIVQGFFAFTTVGSQQTNHLFMLFPPGSHSRFSLICSCKPECTYSNFQLNTVESQPKVNHQNWKNKTSITPKKGKTRPYLAP